MANKKISDFPIGSAAENTQVLVMNGGVTQRITLSQIDTSQLITWSNIAGKPTFAAVSTSGDYTDLANRPFVPADVGDLTDITNLLGASSGPINEITNTDGVNTFNVSVGNTGVIAMNTIRGGLEFGAMPEVGAPNHLHIMRPVGQESSTDLYFGDDYNYVRLPGLYGPGTQGVEIGSSYNSGTVSTWLFGTDGNLTLPAGGDIVDSNGDSVLSAGLTSLTTGNLVVGTGPDSLDGNRIYTSNVGGTITLVPDGGAVEIGVPGETGIFLRFQDGTEQLTAYTTTNKLSTILWVSESGNNTGATGSAEKPFVTVQAAHNFASTNFAAEADVVIIVAPGAYSGFTLTRPRTHLFGFAGQANATRISSTVTIAPTTTVGGVYNSTVTLENFLLDPSSGHAMVISGDQQLNFNGYKLKFYTSNSTQSALVVNNTAAGGIRMYMYDSDLQNQLTSAITADISNVFAGMFKRCNFYGGANLALKTSGTTATLDGCTLYSTFTDIISLTGASTINMGNTTFTNSQANGNGINIAAGATAVVGQCAFDVPLGTGYAVRGVTGSVFVYANNIIAYGKNNKISSAMTSIPMGTSFTPAA